MASLFEMVSSWFESWVERWRSLHEDTRETICDVLAAAFAGMLRAYYRSKKAEG